MTGQTVRKGALMKSGTPSPDPWDLSLSRQNDCFKLEVLERRIGLRRDATRAPIQVPEWQGAGWQSRPQYSTPRPRRTLAYCGQKMVLTMGSTLDLKSPGLHLEALKGDRAGQHSIRIDERYRICFVWQDGKATRVEIVDYH